MNLYIRTVIDWQGQEYPTRIPCFQRKQGQVVLDQMRTVDKKRLVRRLGRVAGG